MACATLVRMKNPFGRREAAPAELPPVPDDVTETWRGSTNEVVLRTSLQAVPDDDRETAEALGTLVLGVVRGVREGEFGHSMPQGAKGASVRLEVAVCEDDYGPYTRHEAEDLVGRLAGVAPLAVVAYPRGGSAPVWDDGAGLLRVDLATEAGSDDASTRGELRALVQATLTSVTTDKVKGIVPEAAGASYSVRIHLTVRGTGGDGFGERSAALLDDMVARLAGTRVQLEVTREP
ncbi:hypothetical protein GCM10025864_30940 [Luteimicrobium album]|uniref:FDX-ACB domain-containing protein n=2 Tax=Luteimicrobium album TaxID=1054550 RepID=A0ABQ6I6E3_9MICO|nr:hypothetical protein GCM10025864_30940 [Luteimicrobium album]